MVNLNRVGTLTPNKTTTAEVHGNKRKECYFFILFYILKQNELITFNKKSFIFMGNVILILLAQLDDRDEELLKRGKRVLCGHPVSSQSHI